MAATANSTTLASMWKHMSSLTPTSSASDIDHITTFFSPNAVVYLSGMGQPPCTSHAELVTATQTLITYWAMVEHKNITHVEQQDGKVIVNAMENKLRIMGDLVEGFRECEVVTFTEEGKIERYELYVDPSPIMAVFAKAQAGNS
jgi:hypothetical protein